MQIKEKSNPAIENCQCPSLPVQRALYIEHEGNDEQKREDGCQPIRLVGVVLKVIPALVTRKGTSKQKHKKLDKRSASMKAKANIWILGSM